MSNFALVVGVSTPALLPLNLDNGLPSRVRACLRQQTEHASKFKGKAFRSCKYLSIFYSRVQGMKQLWRLCTLVTHNTSIKQSWEQIGTLDALVLLSDELVKYDSSIEQTVLKTVDIMRSLLKDQESQLPEYLKVNDSKRFSSRTYASNSFPITLLTCFCESQRILSPTLDHFNGTPWSIELTNLCKRLLNCSIKYGSIYCGVRDSYR